jgi:hypothetical protein
MMGTVIYLGWDILENRQNVFVRGRLWFILWRCRFIAAFRTELGNVGLYSRPFAVLFVSFS